MRAQVQRLNRINADLSNFETIKKIYEKMFEGVTTVVGTTSGGDLFFRARANPSNKPSRLDELIAPPAQFVTGFQRCNAPFSPRFYCSSRRITALRECHVKIGDIVYLSQWIGKDRLPINKVLDPLSDPAFFERLSEAENIFYSHLDTVFTRRVHEAFSNDYKFSAAVAEQLTTRFPRGDFNIDDDGHVGLRYPSVLDLEGSFNIAFPSSFAVQRLQPLHTMELRVEDVQNNIVNVSLLDTAIDFDNGYICWTGNKACVPVPRTAEKAVLFRSNGRKWDIATIDKIVELDLPTDLYVNQLLLE